MFNKGNKGLFAFVMTLIMLTTFVTNAQEGESIFNSKCATCHAPHKDMTGPKLFEVRQKWEEGGAMEGSIYQWVKNWQVAAATDPYAKEVSTWAPSAMTLFADLTNEQIDAVLDYVDEQPLPGAGGGQAAAGSAMVENVTTQENNFSWVWYVLGAVFLVVIFSVGGVKRQLQDLGGDSDQHVKVGSKVWIFKNRKFVGIGVLVTLMAGVVWLLLGLYQIGVVSSYQPSQPIVFPHDIHAGINGIDCKYCHNSTDNSKSAGIPSTNLCMNCHKQIQGAGDQVEQIKKIYASAGFSPEGGGKYSGETDNIIWNKVHDLPDHVYFNHSQHVKVGGIDCKQCHGDMTKQKELPRIVPVEELNEIEGNVQLTKPTLTMGWCIECHGVKEVSTGPIEGKGGYYDEIHKRLLENDESLYGEYLEDGKVTVSELGGWECAKCHY